MFRSVINGFRTLPSVDVESGNYSLGDRLTVLLELGIRVVKFKVITAKGILNKVGEVGGGTATRDPDHGTGGDNIFPVLVSDWGTLDYGDERYKGKPCSCISRENNDVDEEAIKSCIKDFANRYGERYNHRWSWPSGPNCRSFLDDMLGKYCMPESRSRLYTPYSGSS